MFSRDQLPTALLDEHDFAAPPTAPLVPRHPACEQSSTPARRYDVCEVSMEKQALRAHDFRVGANARFRPLPTSASSYHLVLRARWILSDFSQSLSCCAAPSSISLGRGGIARLDQPPRS